MQAVAAKCSIELFLLTILAIVSDTALAADDVDLSLPLVVFPAGMVIGESGVRHEVEDDIKPSQGTLMGLYFFTIGMQVDLHSVAASAAILLVALSVLMVVKPFVMYFSCHSAHRVMNPYCVPRCSLRGAVSAVCSS
mgnify:FL=1